jgi:hydrogenase nickel incorporation protein HypB
MKEMENIRTIEVRKNIQAKNDEIAEKIVQLRKQLGIPMFDIMGTIGSGKTSIIQYIAKHFQNKKRILVINGDLATSIDAERIGQFGATCLQINTGRGCHLNADQVFQALETINLNDFDVIFVENVGNLICPSSHSVGADYKIAITSITEGPYVFQKHPISFRTSNLAILNKVDLSSAMELDPDEIINSAKELYPGLDFLKLSVKTGEGMLDLIERLFKTNH